MMFKLCSLNAKLAIMAKKRLSQNDVPAYSLSQALRVPEVLFESYAGDPTDPMDVAEALEQAPKGSTFRMITGAAIAYGLVDGGAQSASIAATPLSERIFRPTREGEDVEAKREAFRKPRVIQEFLQKYDGNLAPKTDIAVNVLDKMGVPRDRAEAVFADIMEGAKSLGLTREIKGKLYIKLSSPIPVEDSNENPEDGDSGSITELPQATSTETSAVAHPALSVDSNPKSDGAEEARMRRVFITHGKNKELVEPIKQLLAFGEMEPVVSVEKQTVSQPVPDKVLRDMRSCGAAIIHVEGEQTLLDKDGDQHTVLNPNVLIEIGAAMALYGRRFILLVQDGTKLPSNLQGLFEVRYSDTGMDGDATIRLLKAIKDMKAEKAKSL